MNNIPLKSSIHVLFLVFLFVTFNSIDSSFSFQPELDVINTIDTHSQAQTDLQIITNQLSNNINLSLSLSTYLGGNDYDIPKAVEVDLNGSYYMVGATKSSNFNTSGVWSDIILGGTQDGFITKFDKLGKINYSTYLGGSSLDFIADIKSDSNGDIVVVGYTFSSDFPTFGPFADTSHGGGTLDGFLAKFTWDGQMIFSTFIGGSGAENAWGVDIDSSSNIYVTGYTASADFPIIGTNSNGTYGGGIRDVFVQKYNPSGSILYSTYLGGNDAEIGYKIVSDSSQNIYLTGYTASADFPTAGQNAVNSITGTYDIFVTKINSSGIIEFSTYLGGSSITKYAGSYQNEQGNDIIVDQQNNIYVVGYSNSDDFPTIGTNSNSTHGGGSLDMVLSKFNSQGQLIYSSYIGGSGEDNGMRIRLDDNGLLYVFGYSSSSDIPSANTGDTTLGDPFTSDNYIMIYNGTDNLIWTTYLGGSNKDDLQAADIDSNGDLYIGSWVKSLDYNITGQYSDSTYGGGTWDTAISVFRKPDEIAPKITLLNTENNTLIIGGSEIELSIIDGNLDKVVYNWDSSIDMILNSPYIVIAPDIDGSHSLTISANDTLGNNVVIIFQFDVDKTPPGLSISNVSNNSLISIGEIFQVAIIEPYLNSVTYTWDQGQNTTLFSPYRITGPRDNGTYLLSLFATDTSGNAVGIDYVFYLDLIAPEISLQNTINNTSIAAGSTLSFQIDGFPQDSWYSWNGVSNVSFSSPYEILIPNSLGRQTLHVYANDSSGNLAMVDFVFDVIEISQTSGESSTIVTSDTSQSSTITSSDTIDSQTTSTDQTSSSTTSDNQNSEFAEIIITFIALIMILSLVYMILRK